MKPIVLFLVSTFVLLCVGSADAQRLRASSIPPVQQIDCTLAFEEPASETFALSAGSGSVVVNAVDPNCDFSTRIPGGEPWLTVSPGAASGSATITYTLAANGGASTRTATFEVFHGSDEPLSFLIVQQGSDPLPSTPPAAATTPSPADNETDVLRSVSLSANEATDYTSCSILFDDVSPPTNEIDLGSNCSYTPTLNYSTEYFWVLKRTNAYGTTNSAEWSFTTLDDPTPVNPDPTCLSDTPSATGVPYVHWTSCRQDIWDQEEADYIAACPGGVSAVVCSATPKTWGGRLFKENKRLADLPSTSDTVNVGEYDAFMVQATGCATLQPDGVRYAQDAYNRWLSRINAHLGAFEPAPYDFVEVTDNNNKRLYPLKYLAVLEAIKPCITTPEYDAANLRLAEFLQSVRLNGFAHIGLRIGDWDNNLGGCFAIWAHQLINPTMTLANQNLSNYNPVTGIAKNNIGGLDSTADMSTFQTSNSTATCRDYIKWWTTITPNSSAEGMEYNQADLTFMIRGRDAILTLTGVDHFPEILTMMNGEANQLLFMWSPDLREQVDYGDTEQFRSQWIRSTIIVPSMELSGALQGTTPGRKLHDFVVELETMYPMGSLNGFYFGSYGSSALTFYNPYDTQVEWRDSLAMFDAAQRLTIRKSHISNTNASSFMVYSGGPEKWNSALGIPQKGDHNFKPWGDWNLYCDGGACANHPTDYNGPYVKGADGGNGPVVYGLGRLDGYNRLTARHDSQYSSVMAQQGGSLEHLGYCGGAANAPPFMNEWTRNFVYFPNDIIVIFDRGDVETSITNYSTCYSADQRKQMDPFTGLDKELIINHTQGTPTQVGNVFTWTTTHGKNVKMTFLFPTANLDHVIVDEADAASVATPPTVSTDPSFGYSWRYDAVGCTNCTQWEYHYNTKPEQLHSYIRSRSTLNNQFNTFMAVHQFGAETAATLVAIEDAGKVQGVHINPNTGNDSVVLFNSQQGSITLDDSYWDPDHQTQVPQQHLRETGFTFTWTPSTSNTLMLWHGLNPANTWSYTVDGGAPVSFVPDDGNIDGEVPGHWSGTVTVTTGVPHTIVVTGI